MKRQGGLIALVILLVLAASLIGNWLLLKAKDAEHDARTTAETKLGQANAATEACNASIAGLEMAAEERGRKAEAGRQAAAERRKKREAAADKELATPPTVPGNDCKSAKDRIGRWLGSGKP